MSTPLKHALVDHHAPAYMVAYKMDRSDTWLSRVAMGIGDPTDSEKEILAQILGKHVTEIFPPRVQLELNLNPNNDSLATEEATNEK
jgi:hypothetical protein